MRFFNDFDSPQITDLQTWFIDNEIESILIRYWVHRHNDPTAQFGYIRHVIDLGHGKYLVGIQPQDACDESGRYPSIEYYQLDEFHFEIQSCDNEHSEED